MESITATEALQRYNLRRHRAEALFHGILKTIEPHLRDDVRMQDVYGSLVDLFTQEGVEVLTDYDRQHHGLPPRGPDGWTAEEIVELERKRLEALAAPLKPIFIDNIGKNGGEISLDELAAPSRL